MTATELGACARYIDRDLSHLAKMLGTPAEIMRSIQSRFKSPQLQARYILYHWHSAGDGSKQELTDILNDAGFSEAAQV